MSATSKTLVVKQGKPSAPGTVVDTSKATVVPPSSEVKTEAAAREVAERKKETQAKIGSLAKKMTGGAKAKPAKGKAKPRTAGNGGGPTVRITMEWTGKDKRDVAIRDRVRTADGIVIDVIGRWTRKAKTGNVPMVTGRIVSFPKGATLAAGGDGKKVSDRFNAVAADCTHIK